MSVVAALKLHDLRPTSKSTGQAHRRHGGLRSRVHQPDFLHARAIHHHRSQLHLSGSRRTKRQSLLGGFGHCLDHLRMRIPHQHGSPRAEQINILVAVHINERGPRSAGDKAGLSPHRAKRPHRGIHPTRGESAGTVKPFGRKGGVSHGDHSNLPTSSATPAVRALPSVPPRSRWEHPRHQPMPQLPRSGERRTAGNAP